MRDDRVFATNHEAVSAIEPPDAAAGAAIDVVDAFGLQLAGAANVVVVIRVAAVDDDVAGGEHGHERRQHRIDSGGGNHHPNSARRGELLREFLQTGG